MKHQEKCSIEDIRNKIHIADRTRTGRGYLHYAVRFGKFELVKGLLDMGISLSMKSHCDWNILHDASFFDRYEIVEWILNHKAGSWQLLLEQNKFGNTPLHIACNRGFEKIANLMIREVKKREIAKIPRNVVNSTWLHMSVKAKMHEASKLLLSPTKLTIEEKRKCLQLISGVDIFQVSPLQLCCLHSKDELIDVIKFLLNTAEEYAPQKNQLFKIVTYLDETQTTSLQLCFTSNSYESFLLLLKFFVKHAIGNLTSEELKQINPLTHRNVYGYTILHIACRFNKIDMLRRFLLEFDPANITNLEELFYSMDTNIEDISGKKAIDLASLANKVEVSEIFEKFNARKENYRKSKL